MQGQKSTVVWRVISASTRGAAHVRLGLPNQDARLSWATRGESGAAAVLAVSDGHGAARHFRSEAGARLAVETAISLLKQRLVRENAVALDEGPAALTPVLHEIVLAWQRAVTAHAAEHPFTDEEWAALAQDDQPDESRRAIETNVTIAYGTTLLAAVATERHLVCLQLGDGDILCVADDGRTARPMPADPRLLGNQTTSICMPEAWNEFRVQIQQAPLPALVLLSSDGYANSFRSENDFLQIGPDYLQMLRQRGTAALSAELGEILGDASTRGSGDDITLGLIVREDASSVTAPIGGGATVVEGSPEHRITVLEERLADTKNVHQAELQRVETQLAATKQRADRVTIAMVVALAAAIGLGIPAIKAFVDGRAGTTTAASEGDRGKPTSGSETRKPDDGLRPRPAKDDKTPAIAEPDKSEGPEETGVTGGDKSAKKPAASAMVLKVSVKGAAHRVTLHSGSEITAKDIGLETKEFGDGTIAHIVDSAGGAQEIVNDSKKKWKYNEPGSSEDKSLAPQETVTLKPGLVLKFGGARGVVS